jgi:Tfp pilus assembly protein PilV
MHIDSQHEAGFTITELLVSMIMFAVVGMGLFAFTSKSLRTLGLESRGTQAMGELKNAVTLLSTELRMSSSISPYLVGTNAAAVTCTSALNVTSTTVRFLVAEDDATAVNGLHPYYVGYLYDSAQKKLLRGEITSASNTSCILPAGNPASSAVAVTLAENVVAIDSNEDGSIEPVFQLSGDELIVNLGIEVQGSDGLVMTQPITSRIYLRTN